MAIQIGKYKRPGIFIEEIDKSVFSTPTVQGITNLVIGVSKKGPVNTPIRLTTTNDLEAVFGQLDRNLERKGSFFHRTVSKMLESSPVYAMNLLVTDDTLDTLEYKSLSASPYYSNDSIKTGPYRRFFDTTGFWKRDTESFINLTKSNEGYTDRAFNLTNLSDRYITVFVVKTAVSGFDRTLLEWYGSVEKMPSYVSPSDYASDYMVDVVVVAGDWSDYKNLAVDNRWGQYFNTDGLIKEQLRNFANDRNITLLGYYEGLSLIPYFRDLNGTNIFIETTINRYTDSTGLYCAFNADLIEQDFYTGKIDLIGGTLVGSEQLGVDFLSYKENIVETVPFTATPLDLPGNVVALYGATGNSAGYLNQAPHAFGRPQTSGIALNSNRTAWFNEGSTLGIKLDSEPTIVGSGTNSTITVTYDVRNDSEISAYGVIGGQYIPVSSTASFTLYSTDYTFDANVATYSTAFILSSNGIISSVNSFTPNTYPTVGSTDIVLGYINLQVASQSFVSLDSNNVTVNTEDEYVVGDYLDPVYLSTTSYNDFTYGTNSNVHDYYVYDLSNTPGYVQGDIKVVFWNTAGSITSKNYAQWRRLKMFNTILAYINTSYKDRATMIVDAIGTKKSLSGMTITNIVDVSSQDKSFVLKTGLTDTSYIAGPTGGVLTFYKTDNELILGTDQLLTQDVVASTKVGVVAKYSKFYQKFFDGLINEGDYFYSNYLYTSGTVSASIVPTNVTFVNGEASPSPSTSITGSQSIYAGYNYIIFEGLDADTLGLEALDRIKFPTSELNTGVFTIENFSIHSSHTHTQFANELGFTASNFIAYQVSENVTYEQLTGVDMVYNVNLKHYLRMAIDTDGTLEVSFMDNLLQSTVAIDTMVDSTFDVKSELNNLKETLDIQIPDGYTPVANKVLLNGARYTEVKVGDFLEAEILDPSQLPTGQIFQRNLTRILSKRQYTGDTSLTEITCDAPIKKTSYLNTKGGSNYQATRYSTIDQYATTYKGISLKGFRIRQASMPDGTEAKQNQILNLVAKGTPLFKALTNKEAFDFRYLIDAFGLGLTERSKQQLVDICGERLNVFGFINMPSLKSFKNSSSPTFVNSEGVLQAEFIAKGGDPESNPAFLYSFGDGAGVSTVGYFTPYVTVNDNGRPLDFPPASYVATTYMRKHISNVSAVTPWTIAAGVTNGRVTNIAGVEHDFNPTDIEFLNQAQMNPIVLKRNRGYVIETENTALTLYKSALSLIHVREVLVELERELSAMLLDYQWKFNTPDVRAEIKLRADVICETYVNKNGLYNYFNKMDDENNTADVIDAQIGVIDTYVEPIKGMGIIVNNVTILRTGAIAAGGFINA